MRASWACCWLPHPSSNCWGSFESLHPAPHPQSSWSSVINKEVLETRAQVPLAAWLSSICLEQDIKLSPGG